MVVKDIEREDIEFICKVRVIRIHIYIYIYISISRQQ